MSPIEASILKKVQHEPSNGEQLVLAIGEGHLKVRRALFYLTAQGFLRQSYTTKPRANWFAITPRGLTALSEVPS